MAVNVEKEKNLVDLPSLLRNNGVFEGLSRDHARRLQLSLGGLTQDECGIAKDIRKLPFGFFHRLTPERLLFSLQNEAIYTLEQSHKHGGASHDSRTPPSEHHLYDAQHYVFGWVGFWPSTEKFGKAIVTIKPSYWKRHSWATLRSGYEYYMIGENARRIANGKPLLTEKELTYDRYDNPTNEQIIDARREMLREIVMPADYGKVSAHALIALMRRKKHILSKMPDPSGTALKDGLIQLIL